MQFPLVLGSIVMITNRALANFTTVARVERIMPKHLAVSQTSCPLGFLVCRVDVTVLPYGSWDEYVEATMLGNNA